MGKLVAIIIAIIILAGGGWLIFGRDNNKNATPANTSTTPSNAQNQSNASSASTKPAASSSVSIADMAFSPAAITVKKGTKVTWTNNDSTAHTVTADSGSGPASGNLTNGQSYSFTYDTVGTFSYHCSIHPDMTGTVTVTE